jgi:cyclic 2,3-diphosphoglycerate synthetase
LRALALVDGEHYAPVVRDAIASLPYEIVAAVLIGGTEKLRGGEDYGVPLAAGIADGIDRFRPEVVLDLSDEPVLGPVERFRLASSVLARGLPYVGADFRFDPPLLESVGVASIAVVGTGKRVGKTAVTGHLARLVSAHRRTVVVAMGRGGPADPETVAVPPTVEALVELSRSGRHAASDHLETAALAGVATIGCRRCGGGLAGAVFTSNVSEGTRHALDLAPELIVFDGSGAASPPVATDRRVVVVGAHQDPAVAAGYLNEYRLLLADLVVLTMAESESDWERVGDAVRSVVAPAVEIVPTVLRPRPMADVRGRAVAYFSTAPDRAHATLAAHLAGAHGADVVHISGKLADREALHAELETVDAELYLVELKAAAIDVVVEHALSRGRLVALAANDVIPLGGEGVLDEPLLKVAGISL